MQQMKGFSMQTFDLKNSSLRISTHADKLKAIEHELEEARKGMRELEKYRDEHHRAETKRHTYVVNLNSQTRKLAGTKDAKEPSNEEGSKGIGIWNMDYNE
jgi:predicted transcriptional regulator